MHLLLIQQGLEGSKVQLNKSFLRREDEELSGNSTRRGKRIALAYSRPHTPPQNGIKLSTRKLLPWDQICDTSDLLAMQARQLQVRDVDLEDAAFYLQYSGENSKKELDSRQRLHTHELLFGILLHNTKLKFQYSQKRDYRWTGPYKIMDHVSNKATFFPEEFDGTKLALHFTKNRFKGFYTRAPPLQVNESSQGTTTKGRREDDDLQGEKSRNPVLEGCDTVVVVPFRHH